MWIHDLITSTETHITSEIKIHSTTQPHCIVLSAVLEFKIIKDFVVNHAFYLPLHSDFLLINQFLNFVASLDKTIHLNTQQQKKCINLIKNSLKYLIIEKI